jgi:hypothetical protein
VVVVIGQREQFVPNVFGFVRSEFAHPPRLFTVVRDGNGMTVHSTAQASPASSSVFVLVMHWHPNRTLLSQQAVYGWEFDHFPISKANGGSDALWNLRPLNCRDNAANLHNL